MSRKEAHSSQNICSCCAFLWLLTIAACAAILFIAETGNAQDLGHKLPGMIGLDAAKIPEPGLYFVDRVLSYRADELRDRRGDLIPIGELQLRGFSNAFGLSYTFKLPRSFFLTAASAAPLARLSLENHDRPEASFDRFGLGDVFIQPVRLGWRKRTFEVVTAYALYLPTGTSPLAGGQGLSQGHITHEVSAGGSVFGGTNRTSFLTALVSYDHNLRKRNVDLTRGDILQIQGGAGINPLGRLLETGIAAYALWQITDDRGTALPLLLRGARDRVYGIGPELAITVKPIRSQIRMRYAWDLGVRSRPVGNIFIIGLNYVLWRPTP